jgi:hypothetical protein
MRSDGMRRRGRVRRRIAGSRLAGIAALPERLRIAGGHDLRVARDTARWLFTSKEHTNFTYELEQRNREHLAWWVAEVSGRSVAEVREYFQEADSDTALRRHIRETTMAHPRRGLADPDARYGRRVAWYALVRLLRPAFVVETGADKGLGSVLIAAALLRNGYGHLTTIDINQDAAYLLAQRYRTVSDIRIGDSIEMLSMLGPGVELSIHDSVIDEGFEARELSAISPKLGDRGVVISDIAHASLALPAWSESRSRRYLHFQEIPVKHWYRGDAMGASVPAGATT